MKQMPDDTGWTGGDDSTRALLQLTADRGLPPNASVTATLVELAQRHGLIGLLSQASGLPLVRAIQAREVARQEVMKRHLRRLLERLDAEGARAAVIKGPMVAAAYRNPDHRPFSDLDVLVEADAVERVLTVLAEDEFVVSVPEKRPKADKRDIVLRDPSGVSFNLDLHWDLFAYSQLRGSAAGATAEAWRMARHQPDSALGPGWELPAASDVCFLATHAILDHRFRLILFRDFLEVARRGVDWSEVTETASRWGLRSTTYLPLWMASAALGAPIPTGFLDEVRPRSMAVSFLERSLPRVDMARFDGHRAHPVNLASVLLHDSVWHRAALAVRAPWAFPAWSRRVKHHPASPETPRVLVVVTTDRRRGAEVFAERLRDGLLALGWMVDTVSLTTSGENIRADVDPLTGLSPDEVGRLELPIVRALRRRVRSFGADLVVANGGATLRYGILATAGSRARLVYIGIGEPRYWTRSRFSAFANRAMLRRAHRVLAVSKRTRDQLVEFAPGVADRSGFAYTGVPDRFFDLDGAPHGGPLRVVMVGSLSSEKDPMTALRVVASVPNVELRLVGAGPLGPELADEATKSGIAERVRLVGAVEDVAPHLEWGEVLLLTSQTEGLPGAVVEAGAAGMATLAFEVGGIAEAVVNGETGLLVPRGDESALIESLRTLAGNRELVATMGKAARSHTMARFGMDQVIAEYARLLAEAAL